MSSTPETVRADLDCESRSSAVAVECGPERSSLLMFFALIAKTEPAASIARGPPASAYVQVRRDDDGSARVLTAVAGKADGGAEAGFGCITAGTAAVAAVDGDGAEGAGAGTSGGGTAAARLEI